MATPYVESDTRTAVKKNENKYSEAPLSFAYMRNAKYFRSRLQFVSKEFSLVDGGSELKYNIEVYKYNRFSIKYKEHVKHDSHFLFTT